MKRPLVHGKIWTYLKYKCRCDECKTAKSVSNRKYHVKYNSSEKGRATVRLNAKKRYHTITKFLPRKGHEKETPENVKEHGTITAYNNHMCRCTLCKRAWAIERRILVRDPAQITGECIFAGCERQGKKVYGKFCQRHYEMVNNLLRNNRRTIIEIGMACKPYATQE